MSDSHSSPAVKPSKPFPDYPFFAHAGGQREKKIRGKLHYFGTWDNPEAALAKYLSEKDALFSGRKPRPDSSVVTIKDAKRANVQQLK